MGLGTKELNSAEDCFANVLGGVSPTLQGLGYSRRGKTFRREAHGNFAIIEFQRSASNTSDSIKFTLNVGIVCTALVEGGRAAASKTTAMSAHLRVRIGHFLQGHPDRWWLTEPSTNPAPIIDELMVLLTNSVAPFLEHHQTNKALIALWTSGRGPGLTDHQRTRFLCELEALDSPQSITK